jgi:hypothetical protein
MTEGPLPGGHDHASGAAAGSAAVSSAGSTPGSTAADDARRAQLLSTEHWSLLASRSMSWNEAFSRTGTFLSTLSAATVALALAGPAMSFGGAFALFALIVLSVTLFLGIATFVRLVQVNNEDLYWVSGMNLIRGEYARLSPGIEKSFVAGHTLDTEGIARTFAAFDVTSDSSPFHMLITTPAIVAVISSAIAGVIAGLLTIQVGLEVIVALIAGAIVFVVAVLVSISYGRREARRYIARAIQDRFPTSIEPGE